MGHQGHGTSTVRPHGWDLNSKTPWTSHAGYRAWMSHQEHGDMDGHAGHGWANEGMDPTNTLQDSLTWSFSSLLDLPAVPLAHICAKKPLSFYLRKKKKRQKNVAHSFQTRAAENMRKDVRCVLGTRGNPVLHAWGAGGKAHNGFRALCPWVRGCSCSDRKNSLPQTPGSAGCAFHQHGAHIPHHRGCSRWFVFVSFWMHTQEAPRSPMVIPCSLEHTKLQPPALIKTTSFFHPPTSPFPIIFSPPLTPTKHSC